METENNDESVKSGQNAAPHGYKVEDDKNLEQKDLKRTLFGGQDANPDKPGYESHGMGGEAFGETNVNRSGDDEANPSRTAGYTNDYFKRTEPLQEHPEFQNFKPEEQEGEADLNMGRGDVEHGVVDSEATQRYQEGTADNDGDEQKGDQKEDVNSANTSYYTGTPHYKEPGNSSSNQGD